MAEKEKIDVGFDVKINTDWDKATKQFYNEFQSWIKKLDVQEISGNSFNDMLSKYMNLQIEKTTKDMNSKLLKAQKIFENEPKIIGQRQSSKSSSKTRQASVEQERKTREEQQKKNKAETMAILEKEKKQKIAQIKEESALSKKNNEEMQRQQEQELFRNLSASKKIKGTLEKIENLEYEKQEIQKRIDKTEEGKRGSSFYKKQVASVASKDAKISESKLQLESLKKEEVAEKVLRKELLQHQFLSEKENERLVFLYKKKSSSARDTAGKKSPLTQDEKIEYRELQKHSISDTNATQGLKRVLGDTDYKKLIESRNQNIERIKKENDLSIKRIELIEKEFNEKKEALYASPQMGKVTSERIENEKNQIKKDSEQIISTIKQEANRVQKAREEAEKRKQNLSGTMKELGVKRLPIVFEGDEHKYFKGKKDGGKSKQQPSGGIVSVTQLANAISSNSDIGDFMERGRSATKAGVPLEQVYNSSELKRYTNTIKAGERGNVIHKAIEMLETGAVASMHELKKAFDNIGEEVEKTGVGTSFKDYSSGEEFKYSKEVESYLKLKQDLNLGQSVLSEIPLGAIINGQAMGGTLDSLFSSGLLGDFKTGSIDTQEVTVQTNLLKLILEANKNMLAEKYNINVDELVSKMGVIQLKAGQDATMTEIGEAPATEIKGWIEAFRAKEAYPVEDRLQYKFAPKDYDFNDNVGTTAGLMGKYLGNWGNEYNKNYARAYPEQSGLKIVTDEDRLGIEGREDLNKYQKKAILDKTVTREEMGKAAYELQKTIEIITTAFYNSSEEMQEIIKKKIFYSTGEYSGVDEKTAVELDTQTRQLREGKNYKLFSAIRKSMPEQEYNANYDADMEKWEANSLEKKRRMEAGELTFLESTALQEEQAKKSAGENIKKVPNISGITNMIKEIFSSVDEQIKKEQLNIQDSENLIAEAVKSARQIISGYDIQNPKQFLTAIGENFSTGIQTKIKTGGSTMASMDEVTSMASNKASRLLEASDAIDDAIVHLSGILNLSVKTAKDILFATNPEMEIDYNTSKKAQKVFNEKGGINNIEESFSSIFEVFGREIRGISELFGQSDKKVFFSQLKEQLVGDEKGYRKKDTLERRMENTSFGQSITNIKDFDILDSITRMLAIIDSKIKETIEVGDTQENLIKINALKNSKEKLQAQYLLHGGVSLEEANKADTGNVIFYDTETTSIKGRNSKRPVSFGAIPLGANNRNEGIETFLDYGSDDKNFTNVMQAMNVEDEANKGKIIKSSHELRELFGLTKEFGDVLIDITKIPEKIKQQILKQYNSNKQTPEQLLAMMQTKFGTNIRMGGFNTQFDSEAMRNWITDFGSDERVAKGYGSLFNANNLDVRTKANSAFGSMGGSVKGMTLQEINKLFFGKEDESSHGALADAFSTSQAYEALNTFGSERLSKIGEASRQIAESQGVKMKGATGFATPDYKKIVDKVFETASQLGESLDSGSIEDLKSLSLESLTSQLDSEGKALIKLDTIAKEHIDTTKEMSAAEKEKTLTSKILTPQLDKETKAIENNTSAGIENKESDSEHKGISTIVEEDKTKLTEEFITQTAEMNKTSGTSKSKKKQGKKNTKSLLQELSKDKKQELDEIIALVRDLDEAGKRKIFNEVKKEFGSFSIDGVDALSYYGRGISKRKEQNTNKKEDIPQNIPLASINKIEQSRGIVEGALSVSGYSLAPKEIKEIINNYTKQKKLLNDKIKQADKMIESASSDKTKTSAEKKKQQYQIELDSLNENYKPKLIATAEKIVGVTEQDKLEYRDEELTKEIAILESLNLQMGNKEKITTEISTKQKEKEAIEQKLKKIVVQKLSDTLAQRVVQSGGVGLETEFAQEIPSAQINKTENGVTLKPQATKQYHSASDYYNAFSSEARPIEHEKVALKEVQNLYRTQLKNIEEITVAKEAQLRIDKQIKSLTEKGISLEDERIRKLQEQRVEQENQIENIETQYANTNKLMDKTTSGIISEKGKAELSGLRQQYEIESKVSVGSGVRKSLDIEGSEEEKSQKAAMKEYIANLKRKQQYERDSLKIQQQMEGQTDSERMSSQNMLNSLNVQMAGNQTILAGYNQQEGVLNDIKLSKSQQIDFDKQIAGLAGEQSVKLQNISLQAKTQKGLFAQIAGGFKASFRNLTDYTLAYKIIGLIQQSISKLINSTVELDSALVNIQIATGNTREETHDLLIEYNEMANTLGRTTQEVATASNDWLRAGYQGKEAAELTNASMELSTLGQISAADATTNLISVLKGWRIQASEVSKVVDKLAAVDMAAAISAGDLATAMSRANNVARLGGSDMNKYIGYITTVADITQKSAESVGESFKTIYSRFGNVASGKFVASVEEQSSSEYDENEWSDLNDIETTLGVVGIDLRETATSFRDIDDVMSDIGTKWEGFNKTTQNAIATAVAGVRQRENVVTLFENWGQVAKFEEIAANSYGTSAEKMEAFSDSIEASKNRLTVAIENWALFFKGEKTIKGFYDGLTFVTKNLHTLVLTIGALVIAMNAMKALELSQKVIIGAQQKFINLSSIFDRFASGMGNAKGEMAISKKTSTERLNESYDLTVKNNLMNQLNAFSGTVGESTMQLARNVQMQLLDASQKEKNLSTAYLLGNISEDIYTKEMKKLGYTNEQTEALRQNVIALKQNTSAQRAELPREIVENNRRYTARPSAREARIQGGLMAVGAGVGAFGGSGIGEALGGDTGKIIGTALGGTIGMSAMKAIPKTLKTVAKAGGFKAAISGLGAASAAGMALPWLAAGVLAVSGIVKIVNRQKEKQLKAAQQDFKRLAEKYKSVAGSSADAKKYDELSKGVSSLGKNVSLTEEKYQEFLDIGNSLSELFPELTVRTDEAGNSFVGMGDKVGGVASEVEILTRALQAQADTALLKPELLKENLKIAKGSYSEAKGKQEAGKVAYEALKNSEGNDFAFNSKVLDELDKAGIKYTRNPQGNINTGKEFKLGITIEDSEIEKADSKLDKIISTYEQEMSNAVQSMSDEAKSIVRNTLGDMFYELTDEQKQILYGATSSITPDTENYEEMISEVANNMQIAMKDNPIVFSMYYEEQETAKETQEARLNFVQQLLKALPESMSLDDKKGILLHFGFEYDPNSSTPIVDLEDYLTKLERDFDVKAGTSTGVGASLAGTSSARTKSMYVALKTGVISKDSTLSNVQRALSNAELKDSTNKYDKSTYLERSGGDSTKIIGNLNMGDILKQYTAIDNENELNQQIEKDFGILTEETRNALLNSTKQLKKDIKDSSKDLNKSVSDALASLAISLSSNMLTQAREGLKLEIAEAFPTLELDDGLINDYNELSDALQTVADSLNLVKEAEGQWRDSGRISTKTILELVQQNADYADILDLSGDKIKLKAGYQEIINQKQMEAIKLSIKDTIAQDVLTIAINDNRMAEIDNAIASAKKANTLVASVPIIGKYIKQMGAATKVAASLSYAHSSFSKGTFNWGDFSKIWSANYEIDPETNVQGIDTKLLENEKAKLEENNVSLKERDLVLQKLLDDGISLDEIRTDFGPSDKDSSKDNNKDNNLDILEARLALINKEAEAIKALDKAKTLEGGRDTQYYKLQRSGLLNKKKELENSLKTDKTELERLKHLKDIQDVEIALRNLGEEELADKEAWAETLGTSIDRMREIYVAQLKEAATYEEKINIQKKLRDLQDEEYEYQKKINDAMIESITRVRSYLSPLDKAYDNQTDVIVSQYKGKVNEAEKHMRNLMERFKGEVIKTRNPDTGKKYTETEAEDWAKKQDSFIEAQRDYYEALDNIVQIYLDASSAKVDAIQNKIDKMEKARPKEWTSVSQIGDYEADTIAQLNEKIKILKETLNTVDNLTQEQVDGLVNQINDAIVSIKQAQIDAQESIKAHSDSIYNAITWQVNEYIKDINKEKEAINEKYDDEIDKLNIINNAHERTNKLIELENALKDAGKTKKRIYREGIGFVMETDRNAIKKAQQDLDDFYASDKITDLQNAKEAENKVLDDRIQNWQDYLEALEEKHNAYEDSVNQALLFEQLNVTTQEELYNKMYTDMTNYITNANLGAEQYIGVFTTFLDEYAECLKKLDVLNQSATQLYSFNLPNLNNMPNMPNTGNNNGSNNNNSNSGGNGYHFDYHHAAEEAAKKGDWDSVKEALEKREDKVSITGNDYGKTSSDIMKELEDKYGYAAGINNGAITYTGLAMLHGTPQSPEYVLNSDQAYTLLRNFSTLKDNDYETKKVESITNITFGDVKLPNVKDPTNFWTELMRATGNRFNVTKNK